MAEQVKIAGLDIGTTGCKCTVFDEHGAYLGKAYRDYPVKRQVSGHEIDVSVIMDAVYAAIREMAGQYPDIAGIGVTSFGETFVLTDEKGMPLHQAMLYTDPRGKEECMELTEKLGAKKIAQITGLRPHEMYSISKLMWMKKNRPEIYGKAAHAFLMEDYVVFHLTGVAQIDYSLATRTMAFDIRKLNWSREVLEAAGIEEGLFSQTVLTGTAAGTVTPEAAAHTGLSMETKIVSVSHDQVAAAVGAGVFDGETAVDGAGTVECLTPVYDALPDIDVMYEGYFSVVPYVIPGKYVAYAFSYTGGALMQWCIDTLAKQEKKTAKEKNLSVNSLLEREYAGQHDISKSSGREKDHAETQGISQENTKEGLSEEERENLVQNANPSGLLVLPHFAGAATPYMDTGSKGAVIGLTTATTTADLYRGCMEGVVYEMFLNYKKLQGSGIHFKKLHATGGGAHSKVWMQMKADMLNLPITALKTVDAGTVGSAMLTGVAIGLFENLEDAADHMVEQTVTYHPREEMHEKYMQIYERYEKVYEAVRPLV